MPSYRFGAIKTPLGCPPRGFFLLPFAARTRHFFSRPHQAPSTSHQAPNPVGYQRVAIPAGYSIFTPTFKQVDPTKKNTIGDIKVLNENGVEFDGASGTGDNNHHISNARIKLFKVYSAADDHGHAAGDVMTAMNYTTAKYPAGDPKEGQTKKWDANSGVELLNGEGLIVNNTQQPSQTVYFEINGEVEVEPLIAVPPGYSVFGNFTPVDIKVGDITVLNEYGVEFDGASGTGDNNHHISNARIKLFKVYSAADDHGHAAGDVMTAMNYTTAKYQTGDPKAGETKKWDTNSDVVLKAGEALVVNNTQQPSQTVYFKLKSPVAPTTAE